MAQMYFSKFNINSEIYEVYKDENLKDKILKKVFKVMDDDKIYVETDKSADEEDKSVTYKFCDLKKDKDSMSITGRLVKIFQGELQSYDEKNDTVNTRNADNCAASATFFFDLKNEEIAFITRNSLGYNQFNNYFKILIDSYFEDFSFEIFLENNVGELKKKLYSMKRVLSVESVIIPPNANHQDFDEIFGPTKEEFEESGATKAISKVEVPAKGNKKINIKGSYFNRILLAIKKGYATLTVKGQDDNNESNTITSEEHAPYKKTIPEKEKDNLTLFKDRAIVCIRQLLNDKSLKEDDEIDGEKQES